MPKRIDENLKDRAVRLVTEDQQEYPSLSAGCESSGPTARSPATGKRPAPGWAWQGAVITWWNAPPGSCCSHRCRDATPPNWSGQPDRDDCQAPTEPAPLDHLGPRQRDVPPRTVQGRRPASRSTSATPVTRLGSAADQRPATGLESSSPGSLEAWALSQRVLRMRSPFLAPALLRFGPLGLRPMLLADSSVRGHVLAFLLRVVELSRQAAPPVKHAVSFGHATSRSTDAHLYADSTIKEKALALTTPAYARLGRYRRWRSAIGPQSRHRHACRGYEPLLIIPAPTVTPVASSIRMNEPVVRFFE